MHSSLSTYRVPITVLNIEEAKVNQRDMVPAPMELVEIGLNLVNKQRNKIKQLSVIDKVVSAEKQN